MQLYVQLETRKTYAQMYAQTHSHKLRLIRMLPIEKNIEKRKFRYCLKQWNTVELIRFCLKINVLIINIASRSDYFSFIAIQKSFYLNIKTSIIMHPQVIVRTYDLNKHFHHPHLKRGNENMRGWKIMKINEEKFIRKVCTVKKCVYTAQKINFTTQSSWIDY